MSTSGEADMAHPEVASGWSGDSTRDRRQSPNPAAAGRGGAKDIEETEAGRRDWHRAESGTRPRATAAFEAVRMETIQ